MDKRRIIQIGIHVITWIAAIICILIFAPTACWPPGHHPSGQHDSFL